MKDVKTFRRKPDLIQAVRVPSPLTAETADAVRDFCPGLQLYYSRAVNFVEVSLAEGVRNAFPGDWITRDEKGRILVVHHDELSRDYDRVGEVMLAPNAMFCEEERLS